MTDPEIVIAAAEARGWRYGSQPSGQDARIICWNDAQGQYAARYDWNPLENEADFWSLVDLLRSDGFQVFIEIDDKRTFVQVWQPKKAPFHAYDSDRRRAIVLTYLRAKGTRI